jgi:Icc-related predicted phosphoesterase
MVRFLYVTDVHGMVDVFEKVLELATAKDVGFVVFGGDITSGASPSCQKFFLQFYLVRRLKEFRNKTGKPVFVMMGNDDFFSNFPILRKAGRDKIAKALYKGAYRFGDYSIVGYPYVNPTPFLLKDWEKSEDEILKDLEKISGNRNIDRRKAVYVFHAPPYGTKLDMLHGGQHKGSEAIRKFIEEAQPLLTLHGHIHESPRVSGSMTHKIGKTLCINPGNARIISIDLKTMEIRPVGGQK